MRGGEHRCREDNQGQPAESRLTPVSRLLRRRPVISGKKILVMMIVTVPHRNTSALIFDEPG
jgi:hypothetical protein